MVIERNIVFLYPISAKLKELKEEFEKDESLVVYELDSVNEYGQLIGVMEHSITFSSDLKKTQQYLSECKQFARGKTSRNFLIQDKAVPPQIFTKLQKLGLNEVLKEDSHLKSLSHKVGMFFNPFDEQLRKEEEEKNKELPAVLKMDTSLSIGDGKKKDDESSNAVQRIEKIANMNEELPEAIKKKKKPSGLDADFMLGGKLTSNFELKNTDPNNPLLKSPFDSLQRKKVTQFNAVVNKPKLKRSTFEPIVGELSKNPHKKLDIKPPGELNRRKVVDIEFSEAELKRKSNDFKAQESDYERKKVNFEAKEAELKKKRAQFNEVMLDLERKKLAQLDEESSELKRKKFEEVFAELKRKEETFEEVEAELKKKRNLIDEIDLEMKRKKALFDEVALDAKKKSQLIEELFALNKKKIGSFQEMDELSNKKKNLFEQVEADQSVKKLDLFQAAEDKVKSKQFEEVDADLKKKKGLNLEHEDLKRKNVNFEEVESEAKKKKSFDEIEIGIGKKKNTEISELELQRRKLASIGLDFEGKIKKKTFQEVDIEGKKRKPIEFIKKDKSSNYGEDYGYVIKKKNRGEQTINYADFKKKVLEDKLREEAENKIKFAKKVLEDILKEDEYIFYENRSYGLEYLIIYNDFLLNSEMENSSLYKFIHFALFKEFEGVISLFLIDPRIEDLSKSTHNELRSLYKGHDSSKVKLIEGEFSSFLESNFDSLISCSIPVWKDETYQLEINEFIYPFYEDGKYIGFAVGHFNKSIANHDDASKVELLVMSLKGVVLSEYLKIGAKL
jgi:hypothetical protein